MASIFLKFYVCGLIGFLTCLSTGALADTMDSPQRLVIQDSVADNKVSVSNIYLHGNKKTKAFVILRELSLQEGEEYPRESLASLMETDQDKLMNTRLFNSVKIFYTDTLPAGTINLHVDVEERWYTFPAPIIKLADRNFNVWWDENRWDFSQSYYGIRLIQENVGGRNEQLKVIAQFGFLKNFQLHYRFPYIDAKKTKGLKLYVGYLENKNIAINTKNNKLTFFKSDDLLRRSYNASVDFFYRPNYYLYHSLVAGFQHVNVNDTVLEMNSNYFLNGVKRQRYFSLAYEFTYNKRDFISYPTKGSYFNFRITKYGIGILQDVNLAYIDASYARYLPLKHDFYLSGRLTGKLSIPTDQSYYMRTGLGYKRDFIRGYELYVIEGDHYLLEKMTFKKRVLNVVNDFGSFISLEQFQKVPLAIYLKTFYDAGYVGNSAIDNLNLELANRYLWGTGVGLDVVTYYDSVLTFEYSFNSIGEAAFFFSLKADI